VNVSEEYSTGKDYSINYRSGYYRSIIVDINRYTGINGPSLEQDDITIREACGNTVRNVTAQ